MVPFNHVENLGKNICVKTLEFTFPRNPVILLKNSKVQLTGWSNIPVNLLFTSLTPMTFTWTQFQPSAFMAVLVLAFPRTLRNPTFKWPAFSRPPGSWHHFYSSNLCHVCPLASAGAPRLSLPFFSTCINSLLSYCFSKTAEPSGS